MKPFRFALAAALALTSLLAPLTPFGFAQEKPPEYKVPPFKLEKTFTSAELAGDVVDWSHIAGKLPEVWAKGTTGKGMVVGVIDTGANTKHQDLVAQLLSSKDYTRSRFGAEDQNGHGTWCVSHIVGADNGVGIKGGAYGAKARTYKGLGDNGSGSVLGIAQAIIDAVDDGCDVISLSLGGGEPDEYTLKALKYAVSKGVIPVIAAGNDGPREGTVGYPGGFAAGDIPLIVCVAAHADGSGYPTANFSSRGKAVVCIHGGVSTRAGWVGGVDKYATISGTSMATPGVASIALLWCEAAISVKKADRPTAFLKALVESCDGYPNRNTARGYGRPDAVKCVFTTPGQPTDPPVTPPPTLPPYVTIGLGDLSTAKQAELQKAGIGVFEVKVGSGKFGQSPAAVTPSNPPAPVTPKQVHQVGDRLGDTLVWEYLPHSNSFGWVDRGPLMPANQCPGGVCPTPTFIPVTMPSACPGGVCPPIRR